MGTYKGRKCDRSEAEATQVRTDCCPICTLPAHNRDLPAKGENSLMQTCAFFGKNRDLDFGGTEKKREAFRKFHDDICPSCKLPLGTCKKRKIAALERKVRVQVQAGTRGRGKDFYIEEDELAEWLKKPCKEEPDRKKYLPALPEWWTANA